MIVIWHVFNVPVVLAALIVHLGDRGRMLVELHFRQVLGTRCRRQLLRHLALGDRGNTYVALRLVLQLGKVVLYLFS